MNDNPDTRRQTTYTLRGYPHPPKSLEVSCLREDLLPKNRKSSTADESRRLLPGERKKKLNLKAVKAVLTPVLRRPGSQHLELLSIYPFPSSRRPARQ